MVGAEMAAPYSVQAGRGSRTQMKQLLQQLPFQFFSIVRRLAVQV
jgi:hypothetical protein